MIHMSRAMCPECHARDDASCAECHPRSCTSCGIDLEHDGWLCTVCELALWPERPTN